MCIGEAAGGRRFIVEDGSRGDDPRRRMMVQSQEKWKGLAQHYGRHLLAVFVAVLLVHNVFGAHGFLAMHQKQKEIEKVKTQIERLNKENAALEGDVKDLKTDPQTIEKIAREELGQARPGEVIIKLPAAANENGTATKSR
jgi:cell division protein FtsL